MNNPYPPPGPEEYGTGGYSPDPSAMGGQPGYETPPGYGAPTPPPGYGAPVPHPGYGQYGYGQPGPSNSDEKTFSVLTHVLGLLTGFVGPLILFLIQKDTASPYLRHHLTEALNFQLTLLIAYVVSWFLTFIVIGALTWIAALVCGIIFAILAAVAANRGEWYRYPISIRMVK